MCSRETGETTTNDDDLRHSFDTAGREKGELGENPGQRHRVLYRRSISGTCDCLHLSRSARFQRRTAEQPSMRRQIPTCSDSEPRAAEIHVLDSITAFSGSSLGLQVDANRSRIMGNEQSVTPDTSEPQECIVCRNNLPKSRFVSTVLPWKGALNCKHVLQPTTLPTSACTGHQNTVCNACLARHIETGINAKGSIDVKSVRRLSLTVGH